MHSFVHTSGYGLYLYAHVITCARQVKITMATTYDFMPIATKVHESHMVRIRTMYSYA